MKTIFWICNRPWKKISFKTKIKVGVCYTPLPTGFPTRPLGAVQLDKNNWNNWNTCKINSKYRFSQTLSRELLCQMA